MLILLLLTATFYKFWGGFQQNIEFYGILILYFDWKLVSPWFIYNGRSKSGVFQCIYFYFFESQNLKDLRPKLKASVTQVWVATHSLKTSDIKHLWSITTKGTLCRLGLFGDIEQNSLWNIKKIIIRNRHQFSFISSEVIRLVSSESWFDTLLDSAKISKLSIRE